jgi:hypothetical protein
MSPRCAPTAPSSIRCSTTIENGCPVGSEDRFDRRLRAADYDESRRIRSAFRRIHSYGITFPRIRLRSRSAAAAPRSSAGWATTDMLGVAMVSHKSSSNVTIAISSVPRAARHVRGTALGRINRGGASGGTGWMDDAEGSRQGAYNGSGQRMTSRFRLPEYQFATDKEIGT